MPGSARDSGSGPETQAHAALRARGAPAIAEAMSDFADRLRRDPDLYPHSYDALADAVLIVEMTRAGFAAASFLDQRIIDAKTRMQWVPGAPVDAAAAGLTRRDVGYIFHIGHVGSTLLARMMGAHAGVHALREPATLRTLAQLWPDLAAAESPVAPDVFDRRLATFVKLWARTYDPAQRTIVKATSFASELAARLLAASGDAPSLAMYVKPEIYLASILGGENSRQEQKALIQSRLRRLHRRVGTDAWRLHALSEGEQIAASWACEMTALGSVGDQLTWIDFEAFLAAPEAGLAQAFAAAGFEVGAVEVSAIAGGPLLQRYSKGPEHAYTPQLRQQVLDQARRSHGEEIGRGLKWLEAAARDYAPIAAALSR
jgi:hypothetical protein